MKYLNVYKSRWTLFTSTYRVGLSSYLQLVGLPSYLLINLNCFLISISVWTVFISTYHFGLSSQLHVQISTVLIPTDQVVLSSYLRIKLLVFPHTYHNKMSSYCMSSWTVFLYSQVWIFFMSAYQLHCLHIYLPKVNSIHICVPSRLSTYLRSRVDCPSNLDV
jgi:hypothetical protein